VRRKKITRTERELRRAEARKQDQRRKEIERRIDLVERGIDPEAIKLISWEEATIRVFYGEQLPEDVLVETAPLPPVMEFLNRRLRQLPLDDADEALEQAVSELLSSSTPMSARERQDFEDGLRKLKSQRRPRKIRPEVRAQAFEWEINEYVRRGYTADKAKEEVIKAHKLGISIDSLDQFILRHLRKKKSVLAKTVG
jgi:hypothetical protein